jgi:defect-in-organelle-trafficking protein DotD
MKSLSVMVGVILSLLIIGCTNNHNDMAPQQLTQPSLAPVSDAAANEIAEAAASVSHSLTNLEAIEKANMSRQAAKQYPTIAAVSIPGTSSISWNGPLGPLVQQIAQAAHYRVHIVGVPPVSPILVNVQEDQASNADILRNAALQANKRATIHACAATKTIELRYLQQ